MAKSPVVKKSKAKQYPWLQLLELERQRFGGEPEDVLKVKRVRGRPANPIPRSKVHISLTEDEQKNLDHLIQGLSAFRNISRGQVLGLLIMYLNEKLEGIDLSKIKTFTQVVEILEGSITEDLIATEQTKP